MNSDQSDRFKVYVAGLENLITEIDEQGADEILAILYELATQIYDRFPTLDVEEDD